MYTKKTPRTRVLVMKGCPRLGSEATLPVKIQTKDGLKFRTESFDFASHSAGRDAHPEVGILGSLVGQVPSPSWPESPCPLGEGSSVCRQDRAGGPSKSATSWTSLR